MCLLGWRRRSHDETRTCDLSDVCGCAGHLRARQQAVSDEHGLSAGVAAGRPKPLAQDGPSRGLRPRAGVAAQVSCSGHTQAVRAVPGITDVPLAHPLTGLSRRLCLAAGKPGHRRYALRERSPLLVSDMLPALCVTQPAVGRGAGMSPNRRNRRQSKGRYRDDGGELGCGFHDQVPLYSSSVGPGAPRITVAPSRPDAANSTTRRGTEGQD